jgi:hypothetical protein
MLYLGLPVTCPEAFRIFGIDTELAFDEVVKENNWKRDRLSDSHIVPVLNDFFIENSTTIRIYPTDKGQYILGYEMKEASNVWNRLINMDEFIILLINLKTLFTQEIQKLNGDMSCVKLAYMEGDDENPDIVRNPIPYIISW